MQKDSIGMSGISPEVFGTLLSLSKLEMGKLEEEVLSGQVGKLVDYFEVLKKFKENSLDSSLYSAHSEQDLRDSCVQEALTSQDLKKMSTEFMDGYFRAPKVLGSGA